MKALIRSFDDHMEWRLLPVWTSFIFLSGWLGLITITLFAEVGVNASELESLARVLVWVPVFFAACPFVGAALGVVVGRTAQVMQRD